MAFTPQLGTCSISGVKIDFAIKQASKAASIVFSINWSVTSDYAKQSRYVGSHSIIIRIGTCLQLMMIVALIFCCIWHYRAIMVFFILLVTVFWYSETISIVKKRWCLWAAHPLESLKWERKRIDAPGTWSQHDVDNDGQLEIFMKK